jgi:predicted transcriptional regulator
MPRKPSQTLTPGEKRVLDVLWERGEATARAVYEELAPRHKLAYTTVLTVLKVLERKGYVSARADGRALAFRPKTSPKEARGVALRDVVARFFGGSSAALVEHLLQEGDVDPGEIARLEARVAKARRGRKP